MEFIKDVKGDENASKSLVIGKSLILIHTNVRQEEDCWVYDEKQYTPFEYECFLRAIDYTKHIMNKELDKGLFYEGKYYTVTLEKQSLLSSQLGVYTMNSQFGIKAPLTWNATGEACTEWTFTELLQLSNAIALHVAPIIKKQQDQEVKIREANSIEEIQDILDNLN